MRVRFLDGTIRFPATGFQSVNAFDLIADFCDSKISIRRLTCLQLMYGGSLDISAGSQPGSLRIRQRITACGPESALRQATDLQRAIRRFLGRRMNLAESKALAAH